MIRTAFFCIMLMGLVPVIAQNSQVSPPNIVLINIDDLGYSDVACYGKEYGQDFIETPHIDKLAKQSLKFTNGYSAAPICSPSRAALLTSKSPARLNFEFVTKWDKDQFDWESPEWKKMFEGRKFLPPPYTLNLPLEEKTMAEVLKEQGYETAMVGKWHVSTHHKVYNGWNPNFGPAQQGFEWTGDAFGAWDKDAKKAWENAKTGEYPNDELTDKAISFLKKDHKAPFLLYVSHYYVHTPLSTSMKWLINKYRQKAEKKKDLSISEKRILYAAYVDAVDHYVGQLLDAIDELGLKERTLVILTSDNGGMPEFAYTRPFRGSKWNLYEGGVRVPLLIRYPPMISKPSVCEIPVTHMDFIPTFYELATRKLFHSKNIDGHSIVPLFKGTTTPVLKNRSFFWHFPYYHPEGHLYDEAKPSIGKEDGYISKTVPQSAIRKGQFKLIYFFEDDKVELYDLNKDIHEQKDLSKQMPQKAAEMKKELFEYLHRVNARLPKVQNL